MVRPEIPVLPLPPAYCGMLRTPPVNVAAPLVPVVVRLIPDSAAHPVALPLAVIPVGAWPVEQSVGAAASAVAVTVPVPLGAKLAPLPTTIAAEMLVEPLKELNGVDNVLAPLIVTAGPVQAPPTSGVQVMFVPGTILKAEAASGNLNHHVIAEEGL